MTHVHITLTPRTEIPKDVPLTPTQERSMQDIQRGKFYDKRRAIENKLADRELNKLLEEPYDYL